jgi:hypothetical protein
VAENRIDKRADLRMLLILKAPFNSSSDPAGSSGELRNALRLKRADYFYKLHRALDGAGAGISVLFAIK